MPISIDIVCKYTKDSKANSEFPYQFPPVTDEVYMLVLRACNYLGTSISINISSIDAENPVCSLILPFLIPLLIKSTHVLSI